VAPGINGFLRGTDRLGVYRGTRGLPVIGALGAVLLLLLRGLGAGNPGFFCTLIFPELARFGFAGIPVGVFGAKLLAYFEKTGTEGFLATEAFGFREDVRPVFTLATEAFGFREDVRPVFTDELLPGGPPNFDVRFEPGVRPFNGFLTTLGLNSAGLAARLVPNLEAVIFAPNWVGAGFSGF
jgi:hypothetical protein